jgi:hypothetical protein
MRNSVQCPASTQLSFCSPKPIIHGVSHRLLHTASAPAQGRPQPRAERTAGAGCQGVFLRPVPTWGTCAIQGEPHEPPPEARAKAGDARRESTHVSVFVSLLWGAGSAQPVLVSARQTSGSYPHIAPLALLEQVGDALPDVTLTEGAPGYAAGTPVRVSTRPRALSQLALRRGAVDLCPSPVTLGSTHRDARTPAPRPWHALSFTGACALPVRQQAGHPLRRARRFHSHVQQGAFAARSPSPSLPGRAQDTQSPSTRLSRSSSRTCPATCRTTQS